VTLEVLPKGTPLPTPSATPKPTPSPTTPTTPAVIPTPKETLPAVVGKVETIAGPREIAPNQIAPVKQEITLKLSDELVPVRVTVNGKTSGAAINDDGTIELTKLVGPKDKVVVIAQNSETTVQIPVVVKNPLIAIANINFNFASSALTTAAKNILKNVAKVVNDHGFTYINLQGHTDVFAGAGYDNQALSDARSNAAKAYLASLLKNKKVTIVLGGNAAREPVIDSTDSAARAINRRVEILVK
jgi:outer membrane protein OmpA-like peptidoglycan-associated protein